MSLQAMMQSPLYQQAKSMYNSTGGDYNKFEEVARNLCNTRGFNYDQALQVFQQLMDQYRGRWF